MRDVFARETFPQVQFEAADLLIVGEEAIDRHRRARGGAFVERVLVDVGLLPETAQDARVDPALGRTEFIREVDDVETLVIVTFQGCRGAKPS